MRLVFDIIYPTSFLQQCSNCIAVPAYTLLLEQKLWIYTRANQKTALLYCSPNLVLTMLMDMDVTLCSLRRKDRDFRKEQLTGEIKPGFVGVAKVRNPGDAPHSPLTATAQVLAHSHCQK